MHEDHGVGRYQGLITLDTGGSQRRIPVHRIRQGRQAVRAGRATATGQPLLRRLAGTGTAAFAGRRSLGKGQAQGRRKSPRRGRRIARHPGAPACARTAWHWRSIAPCTSRSRPAFPFEETPDQQPGHRSGDRRPGQAPRRWTAWSAATSVSARPKSRCAPRSWPPRPASRSPSWCRPPCWPSSITGISATASPTGRYASKCCRASRSAKEIKAALELLAEGKIDVIIGTHRLLQSDVKFKDLGLVIVDEEQRFGVRQKEALKALRAEVHLLTLTATPIPRTLNMAMSGLRELSIIGTPPAHRLAVKTFITPWDNALLREAFQRELARGGQVYFLHNDVDTIEKMARELAELVPGGAHPRRPRPDARARAGTGHAGFPPPALQRAGVHHHHRIRHRHPQRQHHHHQSRRPFRTGAAAPAARPRRPLASPRLCLPGRAEQEGDDRRRAKSAWRRWPRWRNSAPASPWPRTIWKSAAPANCWARTSRGQIAEIGFSLYTELLERAVTSIRSGKIARPRPEHAPWRRSRTAHPGLIPERLPARRAYAPDAVQAHRPARDEDALQANCRSR